MRTYSILVLEGKERAFIEKVNSRCFCWFLAAIFVYQSGAPIWHLHTKLYKGAWNTWANNSEIVGHNCKDLRLGQIVYILVFYNISFSWLLLLDSFQYNFFCVTVKTIYFAVCISGYSTVKLVPRAPFLRGTTGVCRIGNQRGGLCYILQTEFVILRNELFLFLMLCFKKTFGYFFFAKRVKISPFSLDLPIQLS